MLTFEEALSSQKDLAQLCKVRSIINNEIFCGNFFYGSDSILKQYVGLSQEYPLKVMVPHGVCLSESFITKEEIENSLPMIFCYPYYRKQAYDSAINDRKLEKKVALSASPFLYACELLKGLPTLQRKGTIFFPAHSTFNVFAETDFEKLAEELTHLDDEYNPVTICIYWADFNLGQHIPFQKRGFRIISAGYRDDPNFLFRFYHLCSMHRYAASNVLGSHIFYSVKSGCSYFHLETKTKYYWTARSEEWFKREVAPTALNRELFLKSLFHNRQPSVTAKQIEVVDYYLGAEYFKSPLELRHQLLEAEMLYSKDGELKRYAYLEQSDQQGEISLNKNLTQISNYSSSNKNTFLYPNKNKHILLYTDDSGVGGVAQYNHSILCQLVTLGYQVSCVQGQSSNPLVTYQQELGVKHFWLGFDPIKDFYRTLTNLSDAQQLLTLTKPDLIIFSDACPISNLAAKQVAEQIGIPCITVVGFVATYLAERFATYLDELSRHYAQAKAVIAVSNENLSLLHQFFMLPKDKGQVVYYGRPEQYFAPSKPTVRERLCRELKIPSNAVVCFTTARLETVKGFQYQLEAIRELRQSSVWPQLYFVWVGTGTLESQLRQTVKQLEVDDHVKILGQRWNISDWLDISDIFVFPSEAEGMPLAVMEAMAKGISVIASAVSGIPEELGEAGKLLPDPKINSQATVKELVATIQAWTLNPELRYRLGQAGKRRAEAMFREERMLRETMEIVERAFLPIGDYVSPGLSIIQPDGCFPNMILGDTSACSWPYLRREVPHNWFVDKRQPTVGFLSRDEAQILYNTALKFKGKRALEIGCWLGWSTCHLALAGVELDVIDPLLAKPEFYESVSHSLRTAGVLDSTNLIGDYSPRKVEELAIQLQRKWSLIFIDGDHNAPGPLNDAIICEKVAEVDALIIFHDLASPEVAQGLDYLKQRGWRVIIYQTMQIMGVAWRGNVEPIKHQPDPKISWKLPSHLQSYAVSSIGSKPYFDVTFSQISTEVPQLTKSPSVSVIIPCYEQAHFLPEAVASVVAQTYDNWEIVIVNDGSPDNTSEVAQRIITAHPSKKIQIIEKENGGLASARNAGIAVASSEYILPLDADDILSPNAITYLLQSALMQDSPCVVFGSYEMFGAEQKRVISVEIYSPENIKKFNMLHPSSLFSKEVWELVKGYRVGMIEQGYEDWDFWLSCQQLNINFRGIKEVTTYYRKHSNSMYLVKSRDRHEELYAEIICNHSQLFETNQVSKAVKTIISSKNIPEYLSEFKLSYIQGMVEQYQTNQFDQLIITNLRKIRKQVADIWLDVAAEQLDIVYLSNVGMAHQIILNSGIKYESLTDTEQGFVNKLRDSLTEGFGEPKVIQLILATMLYCRADQLMLQYDLTHIPQWLLNDYLKFIFEFPHLFHEVGEADHYYQYIYRWVDYLHEHVFSNKESTLWQYIAKFFLQSANFIPVYFTTKNLKEVYSKRADVMELALKNQGYQIDYEFSDFSPERKKIRLGILATHFQPSTETFHTLPAYKHLNWNIFEIILYTVNANNNRLERYCTGHADALVPLPSDLASQVQSIRDEDLDLLLIATNVTAVANSITLLALHRLARVQVTFGSSPTTTGMRNIDYFISGSLSETVEGGQEHYREKLVTLDGVGYCLDYPPELETLTIKPDRESWGATEKSVVFISGANFFKIIPELRETWAKILAAVPNSILVLYPFAPSWSASYPATSFVNQMYNVLAKCGVDKSRLVVLDALPSRADVKECLKLADIYLDSYWHSGGHSLVDALEVGLPTVVMEGNPLRARHAAAYLRELQVSNLIVDNEEDYIKMSVALGINPELRCQKSKQIRQRMQANPRFLNSRDYSAQIGTLFQELFQKHQAAALSNNLRLRDINLIIFPNWSQSEDLLYQELAKVITSLVNHPNKNQMTLLLDIGNLSEDEANLILSEVVMNLLLEEDLDVADGPEISLVGQLSEIQWEALLPQIQARIVLENENQGMTVRLKAETIPSYGLDSFSSNIGSS